VGFRRGDASPMCLIELVTETKGVAPKKGRQKGVAKGEKTSAAATAPQPSDTKETEITST
jgi:hypothetical protein